MFVSTKSSRTRGRALKRRKTSKVKDEEEFLQDTAEEPEEVDEGKLCFRCETSLKLLYLLISMVPRRRFHCTGRFGR